MTNSTIRTFTAIICSVLVSAACVAGAVGPAAANGGAAPAAVGSVVSGATA